MLAPGVKQETKALDFASETQAAAWRYGPFPMLMSGGWGSGKTWLGCMKGVYLSTRYRKNRGVIARFRATELRSTTMATFYKVVPPHLYAQRHGGRRNDQNGYMRFVAPYASEVMFLHLDEPETAGIIRGLEINWFLWDQAEENPEHGEELFDMLLARLGRWDVAEVPEAEIAAHEAAHHEPWPYRHPESGKPVPPSYPMLDCNPDVETHWLYRRFHPESREHHEALGEGPTAQPSYEAQGYRLFHMPSEENKFLGDVNRRLLLAQDAAFVRRNVKGIWGQPEGAIHAVSPLSVLPGTRALVEFLRRTCTLYRTMDYGDSAPTAVLWWAVDRNGNCVCWQEYYQPNAVISVHRGNITGLTDPSDHYELDLADPTIFHTMPAKRGGRFCVADEYADVVEQPRATAIFWQAADNNELGTRNRINEYLRVDEDRLNPFTRDKGSPRLFFLTQTPEWPQGIRWALQQTRAQRRVKVGTSLGKPVFSDERDPDIPDHGYDCVRYFIASRPPAPVDAVVTPHAGSFWAARRLAHKHRRLATVR